MLGNVTWEGINMFGKKEILKRNQELQNEVYDLKRTVESLKHLEQKNYELNTVNKDLVERCNKAEQQNRNQTEADLYFTCAKTQEELLQNHKKKEEIQPLINQRLLLESSLNQQRQMQAAIPFQGLGGGLAVLMGKF